MKDRIIKNINIESIEKLLNLANDFLCDIERIEGSLQDNYIIRDAEKIGIGKGKGRKFIILKEVFLNEWSSAIDLIQTDSENKVEKFVNGFNWYTNKMILLTI